MEFPSMVYRSPGRNQAKGGTYDYCGVESQEELDEAIQYGWHTSVEAAVDACNAALEAAERLKNEPKVKIVVPEPEVEVKAAPEAPELVSEDEEEDEKPRRRRK